MQLLHELRSNNENKIRNVLYTHRINYSRSTQLEYFAQINCPTSSFLEYVNKFDQEITNHNKMLPDTDHSE